MNSKDQYSDFDSNRFGDLYSEIIKLLNTEKSYQDPNFSKAILAKKLNTNGSYISKALSLNGNKKFNQLINEYRINQVKEELINKNFQNFTLEYLYMKAGFTQQSTFNRVFKELTGQTPSEYIESINNQ
ncbi:MAG: helix-turn-helix transcriptional regulator [Flavobacterium sp.]